MKKYGIYSLILFVGMLLGAFLFGDLAMNRDGDAKEIEKESKAQIWTCAMHPEVRQSEAGLCPICAMALVVLDDSDALLPEDQFEMTKNALVLSQVQTTIVGSSSGHRVLELSGKIMENEKTYASQTAHFGGRIEQLYINTTGAAVQKGQLLALMYAPELVAAQQELLTAARTKKTHPQLYAAVRNKLKIWKLSEAQIDAISSSGEVITNFPIYANVSGVVAEKKVATGDHVMEGQVLFAIANLASVWAVFDIYEDQLLQVRKGQELQIIPQAYPNTVLVGRIDFIDPVLNAISRTTAARVVLPNTQGLLKPGMFVRARLDDRVTDSEPTSIRVPKSAVLWTGKRSLVYIKVRKDKPVFEMREVYLGQSTETHYEITKGLKPGEEVVVQGTFAIDAAAQLEGKKSMINSIKGDPNA